MKGNWWKVGVAVFWMLWIGMFPGIWFGCHREDRVQVSIRTEIERAIKVKELENKFVFARRVWLGGAGGGGMGAPVVYCSSVQQFIDLVPEKEAIYVAFEFPAIKSSSGRYSYECLKKVYWAFIENRAGLMVYEDEYSYKDYHVEDYNEETVVFHYDNTDSIIILLVLMAVTVGATGVFITFSIWPHS